MVRLFYYDPFKTIRTKLIIISVCDKNIDRDGGVLKINFFNPNVFSWRFQRQAFEFWEVVAELLGYV